MLLPLELKPCRTLWSGDMVLPGVSAGLLGRRPTVLGLRQALLRREVLPECRVLGLCVSKLGSHCWSCAASHMWPCVYAEGQGREMVLASSFSLEQHLHECSSQRSASKGENNLPTLCPRHSSNATSRLSAPGLFACLLFRSRAVPSGLYPS